MSDVLLHYQMLAAARGAEIKQLRDDLTAVTLERDALREELRQIEHIIESNNKEPT